MKQGEIWYASLNPIEGSEQAGYRPVIILSGNLANEYAPMVICCPLTTKLKNYQGNPILEPNEQNGLKEKSEVMMIQVRSISKGRLKEKIGSVPKTTIQKMRQTLDDLLNY